MSYRNDIDPSKINQYTVVQDCDAFIASNQFLTINIISKAIFSSPFILSHQNKGGFHFIDCYFTGLIEINGSFESLMFNNCYFDEGFIIANSNTTIEREFELIGVASKRHIVINDGTFGECRWGFKKETTLNIKGGKYKNLYIGYWGSNSFSKIFIDASNITGSIIISRAIDTVTLRGNIENCTISLLRARINNLLIHDLRNEKGLRINDLKPQAEPNDCKIIIRESYLGKGEIYDTDLSNYKEVIIRDSHLVDLSFTNVNWNYNIQALYGYGDEQQLDYDSKINKHLKIKWHKRIRIKQDSDILSYFQKNRETFRQLKYALSKQGDTINEQKFHALEMENHLNSLHPIKNFEKWIIIGLSKIFSDFGQSFARPLLGLFVINGLLLTLLILTGNYSNLVLFKNISWNATLRGFEELIYLSNPLRKIEDLNGYRSMIDILMRITSSYMIYNIIRATRRFIK